MATSHEPTLYLDRATQAFRWAWWSLALYPVSLIAAFVIGEGLLSLVAEDPDQPAFTDVLLAGVPAVLIFVVPGVLAVVNGRKAARLGRTRGLVPAWIGAVLGVGFVVLNLASYLVALVTG